MPFFNDRRRKMYIETSRLLLRKPTEVDIDDFFEIVSDRQTCLDDGGYEPYQKKMKHIKRISKK